MTKRYFKAALLLTTTALLPFMVAYAQEQAPEPQPPEDDVSVQDTVVVRGQLIPDEKRATS